MKPLLHYTYHASITRINTGANSDINAHYSVIRVKRVHPRAIIRPLLFKWTKAKYSGNLHI